MTRIRILLTVILTTAGCTAVTDFGRFHAATDASPIQDAASGDAGASDAGPDAGPPMDATTMDAPADATAPDSAPPPDAGVDACTADTMHDPNNCGRCGNVCPGAPNAMPVCNAGHCDIQCDPDYDDCNSMPGCETHLTLSMSCGSCTTMCPTSQFCDSSRSGPPICSSTCTGRMCGGACVDTTSDPENCGSCGAACASVPSTATRRCMAGSCVYGCTTGRCDTDGNPSDGCEATMTTYFRDADRDGYGDRTTATEACSPPFTAYATNGDDCNDGASTVHPGATEICDGMDDNCDGMVDNAPGGCGTTCMPTTEVCNRIDDNCDGLVDESTLGTIPAATMMPATFAGAGAQRPRIAFAVQSGVGRFGVVWYEPAGHQVAFAAATDTGALSGTVVPIATGASYAADIAGSSSGWAVAVRSATTAGTAQDVTYYALQPSGASGPMVTIPALGGTAFVPDVRIASAHVGSSDAVAITWLEPDLVLTNPAHARYAIILMAAGSTATVGIGDLETGQVSEPDVTALGSAASPGVFGFAWGSGGAVHYKVMDAGGATLGSMQTISTGSMPGDVRLAYDAAHNRCFMTYMDPMGWSSVDFPATGAVGSPAIQAFPSGTDGATPAYADDETLAFLDGVPGTPPSGSSIMQRFSDPTGSPVLVPGDITTGPPEHTGDFTGTFGSTSAHYAAAFVRGTGGEVSLRIYGCP